jgi:hypothetical protein
MAFHSASAAYPTPQKGSQIVKMEADEDIAFDL